MEDQKKRRDVSKFLQRPNAKRGGRRLPVMQRQSVLAMFDQGKSSAKNRTCGTCSVCCTVLKVRLDGPDGPDTVTKPAHTRCQHLRKLKPSQKGACGIHFKRPTDCAVYKCYWLEGFGEKRDRPDRLGLLMDSSEGIVRGIHALGGIKSVVIHEVRPGANRDPRFRAVIAGVISRNIAVLYRGSGKDLPPVMASEAILDKLNRTMAALNNSSTLAAEHFADGHAEHNDVCPVCVGLCPAHLGYPSEVCEVCQLVATGRELSKASDIT